MKKFEYEFFLESKLEATESILRCCEEKLKEFMTEEGFKNFRKETGEKLINEELESIEDEKIKALVEELLEEFTK